jgi:hypothetical protein
MRQGPLPDNIQINFGGQTMVSFLMMTATCLFKIIEKLQNNSYQDNFENVLIRYQTAINDQDFI